MSALAPARPSAAGPPDGWLLDITDAPDGRGVRLWLKERSNGRVHVELRPFRPPVLVEGPRTLLQQVAEKLARDREVDSVDWCVRRASLFDPKPHRLLSVVVRHNLRRRRVASRIDAWGEYHRLTLYDVDLTAPQLYHLAHGLYPFAPIRSVDGEPVAIEPAETVEYTTPPLSRAVLAVELAGVARGRIVHGDPPIERVRIGDATIEGDEEALLRALVRELQEQDPDILFTDGGDAFELPVLYRRAHAVGLQEADFFLGRAPAPFAPSRGASSYETYGVVRHREAAYPLPGRFHLDRENSFLFDDAAVDGLVDAARLSRLSMQSIARQSPGTCFTAMEIARALADGVHVPWKKNRPEEFKSARALVAADRGGVIFLPPVGVHDRVDEFDFASLYPHIMVRNNLSTETLNCRCCPDSPRRTPGLGYHSCTRRFGLIPRTLEPLLARRLAYKRALKTRDLAPAMRERLERRVKMLKWILVTAFGYQGYRNARFGRIECHEAINAYARELLARLLHEAEGSGYRVVHGIVDSLWVRPAGASGPDPEEFAERMGRRFDLPLGYEGRYRWVVFLPAVTHGLGVPNRYYGMYETGAFKLRGIGSRRHDTPTVLRRFEGEVLDYFRRAKDAADVRVRLDGVLARSDRFAERLKDGSWPRDELLITHRISQDPGSFVTFTDSVAALRQLAEEGADRAAGEYVRYLIMDRRSRSFRHRVRVAERLEGDEPYDAGAYLELLARSAETLLAPLGVDRASLLLRWQAPPVPERDRYTSPQERRQRPLTAE